MTGHGIHNRKRPYATGEHMLYRPGVTPHGLPFTQPSGGSDRELLKLRSRGRCDAALYKTQRPHSGLAGRTPAEGYRRIGQSDHGGHERQPGLA